MNNWRVWQVGDKIKYSWDEFDGKGSLIGTLTEAAADHAIVRAEGMNLWVEDFNADMFERISR